MERNYDYWIVTIINQLVRNCDFVKFDFTFYKTKIG